MRLELSCEAAADLAEIADYTVRNWGEQAADAYVEGLLALFAGEAGPWSRALAGNGLGLRRLTYRSHFIFFKTGADRILIVRVLHRRRDAVRHLP